MDIGGVERVGKLIQRHCVRFGEIASGAEAVGAKVELIAVLVERTRVVATGFARAAPMSCLVPD